jgi:hypothetical protein
MSSTQELVRPGKPEDIYYYDGETSRKQAFPTTVNTKFVQGFQSLGSATAGTQAVYTFPPQNGLQDIVVQFALTLTGAGNVLVGAGLPRGWGYALINRVSFRYGGSSQYFLTGQQILQNAIKRQRNNTAMDNLLTLGGDAYKAGDPANATVVYANCVLTLPHATPCGSGKANPFPTDCLTQQVQVTVETNGWNSIVAGVNGGQVVLSSASFVAQQVMLNNQADALARRVDMSVNAYSFPAEFVQQQTTITLQPTAASQPVVLTGFRSGEVKSLQIWLTKPADLAAGVNKPFKWYLPLRVQMTYAGDVYARFENASSPLWYLLNDEKTPAINTIGMPADAVLPEMFLSQWVELPFSQTLIDEDAHHTLVHGKPITNGIINLDLTTPDAAQYTLNVSYIYNTTLLVSQGTCDFVF